MSRNMYMYISGMVTMSLQIWLVCTLYMYVAVMLICSDCFKMHLGKVCAMCTMYMYVSEAKIMNVCKC